MWNMVRWPRTCGYQPVMNEQRLGVHTGFWQKALRKETASRATRASRFGVMRGGVAHVAQHVAAPLVGVEDHDMGSLGHGGLLYASL